MDNTFRKIIAVIIGLNAVSTMPVEEIPLNSFDIYLKHVMFKVNEEFESMIDNWALDILLQDGNSNKPVACPAANQTDENGVLLECFLPAGLTDANVTENSNIGSDRQNITIGNIQEQKVENITVINDSNNGTLLTQEHQSLFDVWSNTFLNSSSMTTVYEKMRPLMLDPLPLPDKTKLKNFPFLVTMFGSTKDVKVSGLSKYEVKEVNFDSVSNDIKNKFIFPCLNVTGQYDIDFAGPKMHLYGKGPFSVNVSDVLFNFNVGFDENLNHTVKINKFETDFKVGNVSINLENFLEGGPAGDTINKLLNELLPEAVLFSLPEFKSTLEKKVLQYSNQYLNNIYTQNLTDIVTELIA